MESIPVTVKHQGKDYPVELDPTTSGETFKYQVYSLTGVEPDRQKIIIKGVQLKDETDLSKLSVKPGLVIRMMGTPSGTVTIEKPKEKMVFLEDMTEAEAAQTRGAVPPGLKNLGNTCYMNATVQTLKSIPELNEELTKYSGARSAEASSSNESSDAFSSMLQGIASGSSSDVTASLRDLLTRMAKTQDSVVPSLFLAALRAEFPQFAQRSRESNGYAQQDAEEAWSQILTRLRHNLTIKDSTGTEGEKMVPFVDKYMAGTFASVRESEEAEVIAAGEKPDCSTETFFKINCVITGEINHLRDGITAGLVEKHIEKRSEALNRDALYTKTSKITRLPKYLTVHLLRFGWRKDSKKKAKVMRKVSFPQELDIVEFCGKELQEKLAPVRNKYRDVRGQEDDIERAKKRQKRAREDAEPESSKPDKKSKSKEEKGKVTEDTEMPDVVYKTDAEIEAEQLAAVEAAKKELLGLVDEKDAADDSTNHTGLYELRGIITHQGATADSGHYTAFVKKSGYKDPATGKVGQEDGKWWWFNDEKVTEFDSERIETLSGGGQNHSALVLLYRAVPLPTIEKRKGDAPTA